MRRVVYGLCCPDKIYVGETTWKFAMRSRRTLQLKGPPTLAKIPFDLHGVLVDSDGLTRHERWSVLREGLLCLPLCHRRRSSWAASSLLRE